MKCINCEKETDKVFCSDKCLHEAHLIKCINCGKETNETFCSKVCEEKCHLENELKDFKETHRYCNRCGVVFEKNVTGSGDEICPYCIADDGEKSFLEIDLIVSQRERNKLNRQISALKKSIIAMEKSGMREPNKYICCVCGNTMDEFRLVNDRQICKKCEAEGYH